MDIGTNEVSVVHNATQMVPIRVGDYIEYSGIQVGGETIVYGMVVNIDIQTSGSQPGYVRVEDALIGVQDTSPLVESARHRVIHDCFCSVWNAMLMQISSLVWLLDQTYPSLSGQSTKTLVLVRKVTDLWPQPMWSPALGINGK